MSGLWKRNDIGSDGGCCLVPGAKLVVPLEFFRIFLRQRWLRMRIPALSVAYDAMLRPMDSGGASDIVLEYGGS